MTEQPPEPGPAFDAMMHDIDAHLAKEGVPITGRPLRAFRLIGGRYKISLPVIPPSSGSAPELFRYATLSRNVHNWFEKTYADRLKIDFTTGRVVVTIDGDLYVQRIPFARGQVDFVISRQFSEPPMSSSRPVICNVLQLVRDLTPAKAATLSEDALHAIDRIFHMGFSAHYALEANQGLELIRIARGDIDTAVDNLMDRNERYGASKWASLQTAEKIMKAAIAQAGASFGYTHELTSLAKKLMTVGVHFDSKPLIDAIQCGSGIRYGQEACDRAQALAAHHASLELVNRLIAGGAKLQRAPFSYRANDLNGPRVMRHHDGCRQLSFRTATS